MTCRYAKIQNRETRKRDLNIKKIRNRKPISYFVKIITTPDSIIKELWNKLKRIIWGIN